MKTWANLKSEVLESFDFSKVRKTMKALDWQWDRDGIRAVPRKKELMREAEGILNSLIHDLSRNPELGEKSYAIGGFFAQAWLDDGHPNLSLAFQVDEWTAYAQD